MQNQEKNSVARLLKMMQAGSGPVTVSGLSGSADSYLVWRLAKGISAPIIVVADTATHAERFFDDISFFVEDDKSDNLRLFPDYTNFLSSAAAYHNRTAAERIRILYRLSQGGCLQNVFVLALSALEQRLIPRKALNNYAEIIMAGEEIDVEALNRKLVAGGYTHTAIVEEPGDFSVRGGILDIFSPLYAEPVRIELFGDLVESLRFFSPLTQRRTADTEEIILLPARETILAPERIGTVIAAVKKKAAEQEVPLTTTRKIIAQIQEEGGYGIRGGLLPLMYDDLSTFFDYVPDMAVFVLLEGDWESIARDHRERRQYQLHQSRAQGQLLLSPETLFLSWEEIKRILASKRVVQFTTGPVPTPFREVDAGGETISFSVKNNSRISGLLQAGNTGENLLAPFADWIRQKKNKRQTCVIAGGSYNHTERIAYLLGSYGIDPVRKNHFSDCKGSRAPVRLVPGHLSAGFDFFEENLAVICEREIFGKQRPRRAIKKSHRPREQFLQLEELKHGDLVVHVDHGIGSYEGIVNLEVEGLASDFLLLRYKDGDRLYLSVDRMDMVKPYIGVEGVTPVLDKMGGKSWGRTKEKAKQEVQKIAKELLALYAGRKARPGHTFTVADNLLADFEAGFPYEETADQTRVIEEVLADMQSPVPMDRLVCGDVGYGKTEVCLRASFAAVYDGKQVAVMVPTTVLAEQHLTTFQERFADFPITVVCLNRFRTGTQQKQIISDIKQGQADIVIGTHRLLSADIAFRDLGLVVLDEEQRFGVQHKEKLKQMRTTVDVLSLTATPIPRTLHMSLMGVRDISIINTPPDKRRAIKTYVSEFDDNLIADAIRRELERGGQIYFVHNNIHKIRYIANHLQKLVPEVRLGIAHGQLGRNELEGEMMKFVERDIDMLVCTRIIEAGLDIPAANTIFVNRADMFGLSQIYQLRGRVGRSDEQAYAYLFIPRDSALGKDARKRLKVLMEHNDLGSGFQIAMNDLQIRGGGSVLGVSQSGHIAAVGYDLFLQLMEKAVSELKGEPATEELVPEISIPMSAFLSEAYISDMDQRLDFYRRLSRLEELPEIVTIKEEMQDRYGELPETAENLLLKIMLKILAGKTSVKKMDITDTHMLITFSGEHLKNPEAVFSLVQENPDSMEMTPQLVLKVSLKGRKDRSALLFAKNILKAIYRNDNNKQ